jgi:hypothetical protein
VKATSEESAVYWMKVSKISHAEIAMASHPKSSNHSELCVRPDYTIDAIGQCLEEPNQEKK